MSGIECLVLCCVARRLPPRPLKRKTIGARKRRPANTLTAESCEVVRETFGTCPDSVVGWCALLYSIDSRDIAVASLAPEVCIRHQGQALPSRRKYCKEGTPQALVRLEGRRRASPPFCAPQNSNDTRGDHVHSYRGGWEDLRMADAT